jgi:hypothetical protein
MNLATKYDELNSHPYQFYIVLKGADITALLAQEFGKVGVFIETADWS